MAIYQVSPVNAREQETMSRDASTLLQASTGRLARKAGAGMTAGRQAAVSDGRHVG